MEASQDTSLIVTQRPIKRKALDVSIYNGSEHQGNRLKAFCSNTAIQDVGNKAVLPFFKLPQELRDEIYHYAWNTEHIGFWEVIKTDYATTRLKISAKYGYVKTDYFNAPPRTFPTWLNNSHQFRHEALAQFYRCAELEVRYAVPDPMYGIQYQNRQLLSVPSIYRARHLVLPLSALNIGGALDEPLTASLLRSLYDSNSSLQELEIRFRHAFSCSTLPLYDFDFLRTVPRSLAAVRMSVETREWSVLLGWNNNDRIHLPGVVQVKCMRALHSLLKDEKGDVEGRMGDELRQWTCTNGDGTVCWWCEVKVSC